MITNENLAGEDAQQEEAPTQDGAFASWLTHCASARCSSAEQAVLQNWAYRAITRRANDPNVFHAFEARLEDICPAFQQFEIYCQTYPKDTARPSYKNVLLQISASQSPKNAISYAYSFFSAIGRLIRDQFVALENDRKFVKAHGDEKEESRHNLNFISQDPLPYEGLDGQATPFAREVANKCWHVLEDRHKVFLWADLCGIAKTNETFLRKSGVGQSMAYVAFKEANLLLKEKLQESLVAEELGRFGNSESALSILRILQERLRIWAKSENWREEDFLSEEIR